MHKLIKCSIFSLSSLIAMQVSASCGSAFCMLNTNWSAQGVWTEAGARLDMRYETINQNELLHGHSSTSEEEDHIEQNTLNHNLQTTLDYAFNETYGVSVNAPLVSREHTHFHVDALDPSVSEKEVWDFTKLGDVRVIGRMQLSPSSSLHEAYGINMGVKLPTGSYDIRNDDGELAERSLQPGTGTTDIIVGGYYRQQLHAIKSQWFVQASVISPLNTREGYRAGKQFTTDLGYLYHVSTQFSAMLQLNANHKEKDSGENAEPDNSGGHSAFLSPGLSYAVTSSSQVYGFLHHRLTQTVNGEQLSATNSVVVGLSTRF